MSAYQCCGEYDEHAENCVTREVQALRAENETLRNDVHNVVPTWDAAMAELTQLRAENEKLRAEREERNHYLATLKKIEEADRMGYGTSRSYAQMARDALQKGVVTEQNVVVIKEHTTVCERDTTANEGHVTLKDGGSEL